MASFTFCILEAVAGEALQAAGTYVVRTATTVDRGARLGRDPARTGSAPRASRPAVTAASFLAELDASLVKTMALTTPSIRATR